MKFGLCTSIDRIREAYAWGFDYIEPPVTSIASCSDNEFGDILAHSAGCPICCSRFNVLFPGTVQLLEDGTDYTDIKTYLDRAFRRIQQLGGTIVVFGSGRSRRRPEYMSYSSAFRKLADVLRIAGDTAVRYGITLAIEPLNRGETNMLCSMAEAAALAASADHPNVKLLVDYYHVMTDGEPLSDITRLGGFVHAHIAAKAGRRFPLSEEGEAYGEFFSRLMETGYKGTVSIEGTSEDIANDAPKALSLLRRLWAGPSKSI